MAEVKWIKLTTNMFDDEKIRLIESMPDADAILIIWIKLLTLSGKSNAGGYIFLSENIPYTDEMIATVFNRPLNTVRLALETFKRFGMISQDQNGFFIENFEKHQNVVGLEKIKEQNRKRVAKHRQIKKALSIKKVCQYCGAEATGFDHIIARARGGSDNDENKIECCISCNRIKNDKPLVDFLNNNRHRINDDIIQKNSKLKKLVTLCNVTDHYMVTQSNAIDIDKELDIDKDNRDINNPPPCEKIQTAVAEEEFLNKFFNILKNIPDYPFNEHVDKQLFDCLKGLKKEPEEIINALKAFSVICIDDKTTKSMRGRIMAFIAAYKTSTKDVQKTKYEHKTQETGIDYKKFKPPENKREEKSPYTDKQTAIDFIKGFTEEDLKKSFIKKQVKKISERWGLPA